MDLKDMSGRCSPLPESQYNDQSRKQPRQFSECASPFSPKRRLMFVDTLFKGEIFYLDPKAFVGSATVAEIEKNVQLLGGKIEKFMCKDVTCVVSDRKGSSKNVQTSVKDGLSSHCSPSPMSRGQALLLKAQNNSSKNCTDILATAKQLGIKVLDAKHLVTKIQEQLDRCDPNGRWDHAKSSKKKGHCSKKTRAISGNYVKFEHESESFRPVYGRFNNFPGFYFYEDYEGSPFDPEPKKHVPSKKVTPTAKLEGKVSSKYSNSPKVFSGKQKTRKNFIPKPKSGYCESCELHFNDLNHHVQSKIHLNFASHKENFASLDSYLNDLPAISDLISAVSGDSSSSTALQHSATDSHSHNICDKQNEKFKSPSVDHNKNTDVQLSCNTPDLLNIPVKTSPCLNSNHIFGEAFSNKTPSFSTASLMLNEDSVNKSTIQSSLSQNTVPDADEESLAPDKNASNKLYRRLFDVGKPESQVEPTVEQQSICSEYGTIATEESENYTDQGTKTSMQGTLTTPETISHAFGLVLTGVEDESTSASKSVKSDIIDEVINGLDTRKVTGLEEFTIDRTSRELVGQYSEGLHQKGVNGYNISYSDISHPDIYQQGNVSHYNISSFLDNWQPLSSKLDSIIDTVLSGGHAKGLDNIQDGVSVYHPEKDLVYQPEDPLMSLHENLQSFNSCIVQPELLKQDIPSDLSGLVTSQDGCSVSYTAERVFSDISECNTSQGNHHIALSNSDVPSISNVMTLKHSTSLTDNRSSALTPNHLESSQTAHSNSCTASLEPPELSIFEPVLNNVVEYSDPPQLSVCVPVLSEHSVSGSMQLYEEPDSIPEMPVLDAAVTTCTDSSSGSSSSTLCSISTHSSSESSSSAESSSSSLHSSNLFGCQKQVSFAKCKGEVKTLLMDVCTKLFRRILTPKRKRSSYSSKLGTSDIGGTCTEESTGLCEQMNDCSLTREVDTGLDILKQLCDNFIVPESQEKESKCEDVSGQIVGVPESQEKEGKCEDVSDKLEPSSDRLDMCAPSAPEGKCRHSFIPADTNVQESIVNNMEPGSEGQGEDNMLDNNRVREEVVDGTKSRNRHAVPEVEDMVIKAEELPGEIMNDIKSESMLLLGSNQACGNGSVLEDAQSKHEYSFVSDSDGDSKWNTSLKLTCDNILNNLETDIKGTNTTDNSITGSSPYPIHSSGEANSADSMSYQSLYKSYTQAADNERLHSVPMSCSTQHSSIDVHIENNYNDFCGLQSSIATVLKESMQMVDGVGTNAEDCYAAQSPTEEVPEFTHTIHPQHLYMPEVYVSPNIAAQYIDPLQNVDSIIKSLPFKKRHLMMDLQQVATKPFAKKKKEPLVKGRKKPAKRSEKCKKKVFSSKVPFSMKKAALETNTGDKTNVLPLIDESSCDSAIIDVCGVSDEEDSTLDRTLVAMTTDSQACGESISNQRHFPVSDMTKQSREGQIMPRMDSFESSCSLKSTSSGYVSEIHCSTKVRPNLPKKRGRPRKSSNKENRVEKGVRHGKKRTQSETVDSDEDVEVLTKKWRGSGDMGTSDHYEDKVLSKETSDTEWAIKPLGGLKLKLSRMSSFEASGSEQTQDEGDNVETVSSLKVSLRRRETQGYTTETFLHNQDTIKPTKVKKRKSVI